MYSGGPVPQPYRLKSTSSPGTKNLASALHPATYSFSIFSSAQGAACFFIVEGFSFGKINNFVFTKHEKTIKKMHKILTIPAHTRSTVQPGPEPIVFVLVIKNVL
jgi:hypothetical protein